MHFMLSANEADGGSQGGQGESGLTGEIFLYPKYPYDRINDKIEYKRI